ncbi:MAG: hypothetical protein J5850_05390, partial [Clostridia bacterium]|nr:hypothetical protein [Clostridia bacterium]
MKIKQYLSVFLLMIMLLSLIACGKDNPPETTTQSDVDLNSIVIDDSYVITCPSSKSEVAATGLGKELRRKIAAQIGVNLGIQDDWVKNEADIPEKEILVGKTKRAESQA